MNLNKRTVQDKIINVADKLGNSFLKNQQGTTKMVWDSLDLSTETRYKFFEESQTRTFPFTNVTKGGQLKTGEAIAIQRISFAGVELTAAGNVANVISLEDLIAVAGFEPLAMAEFQITIANDVVMLPIRLLHVLPQYNKNAYNADSCVFEFNTDLIINPQLDFSIDLRTPTLTPGLTNYKLTCTIEGVGAQLNLKANM